MNLTAFESVALKNHFHKIPERVKILAMGAYYKIKPWGPLERVGTWVVGAKSRWVRQAGREGVIGLWPHLVLGGL